MVPSDVVVFFQNTYKGVTSDIFFDTNGYNQNTLFVVSAVDLSKNGTPVVQTRMTWTPSSGLNLTETRLLPNSFSDLEQRTIKVATLEVCSFFLSTSHTLSRCLCWNFLLERSYMYCSFQAAPFVIKQVVNNEVNWTGFCFDLLNELAHRLNFRQASL